MTEDVKRVTVTVEVGGQVVTLTDEKWSEGGNPRFIAAEAYAGIVKTADRMRNALAEVHGSTATIYHHHEAWMIRDGADGALYCAACGQTVTEGEANRARERARR